MRMVLFSSLLVFKLKKAADNLGNGVRSFIITFSFIFMTYSYNKIPHQALIVIMQDLTSAFHSPQNKCLRPCQGFKLPDVAPIILFWTCLERGDRRKGQGCFAIFTIGHWTLLFR